MNLDWSTVRGRRKSEMAFETAVVFKSVQHWDDGTGFKPYSVSAWLYAEESWRGYRNLCFFVIVSEVPSGIFADIYGRKRSFIISCVTGVLSAAVIASSHHFLFVIMGLFFMALSTSFASGSLDAIAVEDAAARGGEKEVSRTVSILTGLQCAGLASGALAGGFLPYIKGYIGHLKQMGLVLMDSSLLKSMGICILAVSAVQAALETYWQPRLVQILGDNRQMIFGMLSAAAYLATVVGCMAVGGICAAEKKRNIFLYYMVSFGVVGVTAGLSFAMNPFAFSVLYCIIYFFTGIRSVPEQILINQEVPDEIRASVLSVTSFTARAGGMLSGMLSSLLIGEGGIDGIWRVNVLAAGAGVLAGFLYDAIKRMRRENPLI